jgi:glycerol-3-phosphate dehydrogenase
MAWMQRDTDKLSEGRYDLLILGAGIQGAYIARLAAAAGLSVALVDRGDFGAGTSHNSFKLIHAGFRYLQHADVPRIRQSITSTRDWLQTAPEFIEPLEFLMPTYGHGIRGPEALFIAGKLYSMLTMDRNRGLPDAAKLPAAHVLSRADVMKRLPDIPSEKLSGGVVWYDGQIQDADRLLLRTVQRAVDDGADVANHLEAKALIREGDAVCGAELEDALTGRSVHIRAAMTVLSCGPWTSSFLQTQGLGSPNDLGSALVKGINLVIRGRRLECGLGVASRRTADAVIGQSKRLYFLTPWNDCTVAGTTHEPYTGDPAEFEITADDVSAFVAQLNRAYPKLALELSDVVYCYGGLTPGNDGADLSSMRSRTSAIVDHETSEGIRGLMSVVGVKYTTSAYLARRVVSHLVKRIGRELGSHEQLRPLFDNGEFDEYMQRLDESKPDEWVTHAVKNEMAVDLTDALLRRSNLAERGKLSLSDARRAASVMQGLHGWSDEQTSSQLQALQDELDQHHASLTAG